MMKVIHLLVSAFFGLLSMPIMAASAEDMTADMAPHGNLRRLVQGKGKIYHTSKMIDDVRKMNLTRHLYNRKFDPIDHGGRDGT